MDNNNRKKIEQIIEAIAIATEIEKENFKAIRIIETVKNSLNDIYLTNKQKTVLELIGKGLNITQIAEKMGITYQAIQNHKDRIVTKVVKHFEMEVFF